METKKIDLDFFWKIRLKMQAECNRLQEEGDKEWAEGEKLQAESDKLRTEGKNRQDNASILWKAINELKKENDKLWEKAIEQKYGRKIKVEWRNYHESKKSYECWLETGEVFEP